MKELLRFKFGPISVSFKNKKKLIEVLTTKKWPFNLFLFEAFSEDIFRNFEVIGLNLSL